MKAVIQVVNNAILKVENKTISKIKKGMVIFFCVEKGDTEEKLNFFAKKIPLLRIFQDINGKTNLSIKDIGGEVLFVSQFTLAGKLEHSNRPDFFNAEEPKRAKEMYEKLAKMLIDNGLSVKLGIFGADMKITQENDGPFTLIIEK